MMVCMKHCVTFCNAGVRAGIVRIEFCGSGEHSPRQEQVRLRKPMRKLPTAQVIGMGFDIIRRRPLDRLLFFR
jgi:hypothetical protein